jgi:hypothetical protein
MDRFKRLFLWALYGLATVQFVWCYLWLVRPYVQTVWYEHGEERMPFQGRLLMMYPMRWSHTNAPLVWLSSWLSHYIFWFPRVVSPEVLTQAAISLVCIGITGWAATRIYEAASERKLLTPLIYPLVLILCVATYVLHTIQNFRFIYDLPSLAFFSLALYVLYFRKPLRWFVAIFLVATINRETTLLLLAFFLLDRAVVKGHFDWHRLYAWSELRIVLPLAAFWGAWQIWIHHVFAHSRSEMYSRMPQNLSFFVLPQAWPQMLGGCCYLLPIVVLFRRDLRDPRLRAWLWVLPAWFGFMFVYGILIETRIFGELIPYVAVAGALMGETVLARRIGNAPPATEQMKLSEPLRDAA